MIVFLYYSFLIVVIIQFVFYGYFYFRFAFYKEKEHNARKNCALSIIVCAKNEAENCKENIPYLLEQDLANFELVLINDNSYDDTLAIFESFARKHKNIKIVNVRENEYFNSGKKYALSLGIKAASHEHLLFTDADCKPSSKSWARLIANSFTEHKKIVLAYSAYQKEKGFLNKLIRYETLITALNYFSFQLAEKPYMGVGRNLAYTKATFMDNNGFYTHLKVPSGDDDLFINEVATASNTTININPKAFTISKAKTTYKDWFRQKRRHINTAKYYKKIHQVLLAVNYSSLLLFWLIGIVLIILQFQWQVVVGLLALKLLLQYIIIFASAKKLEEKDLIIFSPILEIVLIVMQLAQFLINKIKKPTHWN